MTKHPKITLSLMAHPPMEVEGFKTVCPDLAVHRTVGSQQYWSVTHIQTGAKVAGYVPQRLAFKIAAILGALMDWDAPSEDGLKPRFMALPEVWRKWAAGWAHGS